MAEVTTRTAAVRVIQQAPSAGSPRRGRSPSQLPLDEGVVDSTDVDEDYDQDDDEDDDGTAALSLPGWRAHLVALEAALAAAEAKVSAASSASVGSRRRASRSPPRHPRLPTTSSPVSSLTCGGGPPSLPISPTASWSMTGSLGSVSDVGAFLPGSPTEEILSEEGVATAGLAAKTATAAFATTAAAVPASRAPVGRPYWAADVTAVEDLLAAATAEVVASRVALAEVTGALGARDWAGRVGDGGGGGSGGSSSHRDAGTPAQHPLSALVASVLGGIAALAGRWSGRRWAGW
ncbi:hypothetical protein MMPV_001065 [Pyropia vietnamensis]